MKTRNSAIGEYPIRADNSGNAQGGIPIQVEPFFCDFGVVESGYEPTDPVRFVIKNTGRVPIRGLSVSIEDRDAEKYWLCLAHIADTLGGAGSHNSETCFYAYPLDELGCGPHKASVCIRADGTAPLYVPLSFLVRPRKSLPVSSDLNTDT